MPSQIDDLKTSLVNDLWLPIAKKGGDQLYPRLKKHKKMKLFTLTDMNYQEVRVFEDNKLTRREDVVAWNHSHQQAYRLETELGRSKVFCEGRFDDAVIDESEALSDFFPCDILNLDYSSQKPTSHSGRIEREINGECVIVNLLNDLQTKGFVLLYTTLLDQIDLSSNNLSFSFNSSRTFPNPVDAIDDKVEFIRSALISTLKNNYYCVNESDELLIHLNRTNNKIFSIGFVASRSH